MNNQNNENNNINNIDVNNMFANMNTANQVPNAQNNTLNTPNVAPVDPMVSQNQGLPVQDLNNMNVNQPQAMNVTPSPETPNLTPVFPNEVVNTPVSPQQMGGDLNNQQNTNNNLTFTMPGEQVNNNVQNIPTNVENKNLVQQTPPSMNQPVQNEQMGATQTNIEPINVATPNNGNIQGAVNNNLTTPESSNGINGNNVPNNNVVDNSQPAATPASSPKKEKKPFKIMYLVYIIVIAVLAGILIMMLTKTGPFKTEEVPVNPGQGQGTSQGEQSNVNDNLDDDSNNNISDPALDGDANLDSSDNPQLNQDENIDLDNPDEPTTNEDEEDNSETENPGPGGPNSTPME